MATHRVGCNYDWQWLSQSQCNIGIFIVSIFVTNQYNKWRYFFCCCLLLPAKKPQLFHSNTSMFSISNQVKDKSHSTKKLSLASSIGFYTTFFGKCVQKKICVFGLWPCLLILFSFFFHMKSEVHRKINKKIAIKNISNWRHFIELTFW